MIWPRGSELASGRVRNRACIPPTTFPVYPRTEARHAMLALRLGMPQLGRYAELMGQLSTWLQEITGFHTILLQPNSGSNGAALPYEPTSTWPLHGPLT